MGVLVNPLNVRPQLLQRNRNNPFERPQPTISRPAQCGQPWLSTRSTLVVPSASFWRPRLPAFFAEPPPSAPTALAFSSAAIASVRCPSFIPEIADSQAVKSSAFIEYLPSIRPTLNKPTANAIRANATTIAIVPDPCR